MDNAAVQTPHGDLGDFYQLSPGIQKERQEVLLFLAHQPASHQPDHVLGVLQHRLFHGLSVAFQTSPQLKGRPYLACLGLANPLHFGQFFHGGAGQPLEVTEPAQQTLCRYRYRLPGDTTAHYQCQNLLHRQGIRTELLHSLPRPLGNRQVVNRE